MMWLRWRNKWHRYQSGGRTVCGRDVPQVIEATIVGRPGPPGGGQACLACLRMGVQADAADLVTGLVAAIAVAAVAEAHPPPEDGA